VELVVFGGWRAGSVLAFSAVPWPSSLGGTEAGSPPTPAPLRRRPTSESWECSANYRNCQFDGRSSPWTAEENFSIACGKRLLRLGRLFPLSGRFPRGPVPVGRDSNPSFGQGLKGYASALRPPTATRRWQLDGRKACGPLCCTTDPRYFRRGTGSQEIAAPGTRHPAHIS